MSNQECTEQHGPKYLIEFIKKNKIDVLTNFARLLAIVFAFQYFVPVFITSYNAYYKVLLANAAAYTLRLHHHIKGIHFTREFLNRLFLEDSFHYVFYSLIFICVCSHPITLVLLPPCLYAVMHNASFFGNLFKDSKVAYYLRSFTSYSENLFRVIALAEIVLLPILLLDFISGRNNPITLFLYYQFVYHRYASRRNPYTKIMFQEINLICYQIINSPRCPNFIRSLIQMLISAVRYLAPSLHNA